MFAVGQGLNGETRVFNIEHVAYFSIVKPRADEEVFDIIAYIPNEPEIWVSPKRMSFDTMNHWFNKYVGASV